MNGNLSMQPEEISATVQNVLNKSEELTGIINSITQIVEGTAEAWTDLASIEYAENLTAYQTIIQELNRNYVLAMDTLKGDTEIHVDTAAANAAAVKNTLFPY